MLNRTPAWTLISIFTLASCITSSSEDTGLQTQTGSDDKSDGDTSGGGTGCIEGNCGSDGSGPGEGSGSGSGSSATCELASALGDIDPVKLGDHDATSRGQRCLDCHNTDPHPELGSQPPRFDFGGRVVDPMTGLGRANAVVRVPGQIGVALRTNKFGYFWYPDATAGYYEGANGEPVTFPVTVGVETNGTVNTMCAKATSGNCASCHDGTTTAMIF